MPKVRYKELVVEIQGTMYDVVFKKSRKGKTIVTKKPDMSNVEWSPAQKNNWKQMPYANDYAKAAIAKHPRSKAEWDGRPKCAGSV